MAISAEHHNSIFFQNMHSSFIFLNEVLLIASNIGKQDWKGGENINLLIETRYSPHIWLSLEFSDALHALENFGGTKFRGPTNISETTLLGFPGLLCNLVVSISSIILCILSYVNSNPFVWVRCVFLLPDLYFQLDCKPLVGWSHILQSHAHPALLQYLI